MKKILPAVLSLILIANAQGSTIPVPPQNKPPAPKALPAQKSSAPAPQTPASAAKPLTPAMIYTASNLRDPFRKASGGSSTGSRKPFKLSDFNIHNLILQGLMVGENSNFALLTDANYRTGFILKGSRIYNSRGKMIPGVSGRLDPRRKTVYLKAQDGDVQVLRMKRKTLK